MVFWLECALERSPELGRSVSAHSNQRRCDPLVWNPWLHALITLTPRMVWLSFPHLQEVTEVRHMLDNRYDDIKSGRVKPFDGEAFFERLRQRETSY